MKKIIAVSAALALVAGSAFAEVEISGEAYMGINLVQGGNEFGFTGPVNGDGEPGSLLIGRAAYGLAAIYFWAENETNVGTFGAYAGFGTGTGNIDDIWIDDVGTFWRPNEMLLVAAGTGLYSFINPANWQTSHRYGANTPLVGLNVSQVAGGQLGGQAFDLGKPFVRDSGRVPGFGSGLGVVITPMGDLLNVAIGLPYEWGFAVQNSASAPELLDVLRGLYLHAYTNLDFGRVGVAYYGGSQTEETDDDGIPTGLTTTGLGAIHAFFTSSSLVDGLSLRAAVRFGLPEQYEVAVGSTSETSAGYSDLTVGLGARYIMGAFYVHVNAGVGFKFGGDEGNKASELEDATQLAFEVAPGFDITENVSATLYAGLGFDLAGSDVSDYPAKVWWAANPYVTVNLGSSRFHAGFQLYGNNGSVVDGGNSRENGPVNWAIPIGFGVVF